MGEKRSVYRVLVGKTGAKTPRGRLRLRLEYNIKMDLREWDVVVWARYSWLRIGTDGGHL